MPSSQPDVDNTGRTALSSELHRKSGWPLSMVIRRRPDWFVLIGLALLGACVFLPRLGAFPLWDPWEPHYSQVAWEMQNHRTWTEPIYRNVNNWWSKPVLMLWLLRASFLWLWDSSNAFAHPEFAARFPFAILAIGGALAQYDWVRRLFGRGIAAVSSVVLLTSAQYVLIGRQVMADMVMVVTHSTAMGYLAVGLFRARYSSLRRPHLDTAIHNRWPFAIFWSLEGFSVLAKGFVPPTLAVLSLTSYAVLTYARGQTHHRSPRDEAKRLAARVALAIFAMLATGWLLHEIGRAESFNQEQRELTKACVLSGAMLLVTLGIFGATPPSQHVLKLLTRMHCGWGLTLFLAIAAPWYAAMTVRHGWNYWSTFIFFHHLGRASGTIHLPGSTFDFYLRQWGFAMFPWTGFVVGGVVTLIARTRKKLNAVARRDIFVVAQIVAPTTFLMLAGTKFAHYVFPIVPSSALCAALVMTRYRRAKHAVSQRNVESAWGGQIGLVGLLALCVTLVLLVDVRHDVRNVLRVFVYYFSRNTPFDYHPARALTLVTIPVVLAAASLVFLRRVRPWQTILAVMGGTAFAFYLSWITMPAMGSTYSYAPLYA
ncbi:MAG TPA: glycosyltransferase family 39 protein, partial [Polyangiaceae bacterium]